MNGHGLTDVIEFEYPDSASALFASLERAYEEGEPWLGYLWGPATKVARELDLTILEQPSWTAPCAESDYKCGYSRSTVRIAVHPTLVTRAPQVVEFLRRWDFNADTEIAVTDHLSRTESDYSQTAVWFLKNHKEVWTDWVPTEVAENIRKALQSE